MKARTSWFCWTSYGWGAHLGALAVCLIDARMKHWPYSFGQFRWDCGLVCLGCALAVHAAGCLIERRARKGDDDERH